MRDALLQEEDQARGKKRGEATKSEDGGLAGGSDDDSDGVELKQLEKGASAATQFLYFNYALNTNPKILGVLQSRRFELLSFLENALEVTGNPTDGVNDDANRGKNDNEEEEDEEEDGPARHNVNGPGAVAISWEDVVRRCVSYVKVTQAEGSVNDGATMRVFELFGTHLLKARYVEPLDGDISLLYEEEGSVGGMSAIELQKFKETQTALDGLGVVPIVLEAIAADDPGTQMKPLVRAAVELLIELQLGGNSVTQSSVAEYINSQGGTRLLSALRSRITNTSAVIEVRRNESLALG